MGPEFKEVLWELVKLELDQAILPTNRDENVVENPELPLEKVA